MRLTPSALVSFLTTTLTIFTVFGAFAAFARAFFLEAMTLSFPRTHPR
jgi:hypothetical protein